MQGLDGLLGSAQLLENGRQGSPGFVVLRGQGHNLYKKAKGKLMNIEKAGFELPIRDKNSLETL